jgi:hypothetical protein
MTNLSYYTSERATWDYLTDIAEAGIKGLYQTWKEKRSIDPFLISWPAETLLDDNGIMLEGPCSLDLPPERESWSQTIRYFTQRTQAYALLLTEQKEEEVRIILESHHGTRSWTLPIQLSGDLRVLGAPKREDDTQCIGLLWNPARRKS